MISSNRRLFNKRKWKCRLLPYKPERKSFSWTKQQTHMPRLLSLYMLLSACASHTVCTVYVVYVQASKCAWRQRKRHVFTGQLTSSSGSQRHAVEGRTFHEIHYGIYSYNSFLNQQKSGDNGLQSSSWCNQIVLFSQWDTYTVLHPFTRLDAAVIIVNLNFVKSFACSACRDWTRGSVGTNLDIVLFGCGLKWRYLGAHTLFSHSKAAGRREREKKGSGERFSWWS